MRVGGARWGLLAVLAIAAPLLFFDLGGPWLWEDEGDTAAFARNIVATGVPTAWDGRNFFDGDSGFREVPRLLGHDLVMVGTPWLPFYATAASFTLFGESNATARLPFALTKTQQMVVGLRYVCALLPIAAAVTGLVVARASGGRPLAYVALLVLFGATHLAGTAFRGSGWARAATSAAGSSS
jgi:hypothetical protein